MLNNIRNNKTINRLLRGVLKNLSKNNRKVLNFLMKRVRTSGEIACEFNGVQFTMFNNCDDNLVDYFYYGKKYPEEIDLKLFMRLSKHCKCILDIGANTGLFSILSSKGNSNAQIFAFEPYSSNANRMKKNVELNNLKNVLVLEEAIGNYVGNLDISIPDNDSITDVSSANLDFSKKIYKSINWKITRVPVSTIDEFSKSISMRIELIKCDVETFEMEVFKGMGNTLVNHRPLIIFECFLDKERKDFFNQILTTYNYYLYLILEQGLVYSKEGFVNANFGLNYLISPIKPVRTFLSFSYENLVNEILINRTQEESEL